MKENSSSLKNSRIPKKALVLAPGGAKGSFQLGALKYIIDEQKTKFDIVIGASIGALNGALVAQGDLKQLEDIWTDVKPSWAVGGLKFNDFRKGLISLDPLKEKLNEFFDQNKIIENGVKFRIYAVNLQTGELKSATEHDPDLKKYLLASAAIPVIFRPIEIMGNQYIDGGIKLDSPLTPAIHLGADEIIVILTRRRKEKPVDEKFESMFNIGIRSMDLILAELFNSSIHRVEKINTMIDNWEKMKSEVGMFGGWGLRKIEKSPSFFLKEYKKVKLTVIEPDGSLPSSLDFSKDGIRDGIDSGYRIAKQVLNRS